MSACAARRTAGLAVAAPPSVDSLIYPSRLVLALDGIDYRDIVTAREHGLFSAFRAPSRVISTFPSISDISWHEMFGVLPPPGYQRIYYSNAQREMVGVAFDQLKPIEFEERMDLAFDAKFHHVGAYLISNTIARREIDTDLREFFALKGRRTAYFYNVGPDALQHTQGDLDAYLRYLDRQLDTLLTVYRRRTGRELEVVLISDHGNNHVNNARFVPIEKTLRAQGFRIAEALQSPMDVAFSVDGLTTGFGVFCDPSAIVRVSTALVNMEGVELVSRRVNDSTFAVMSGTSLGYIDVRPGTARTPESTRYRYRMIDGDPLRYSAIVARMREERSLDDDGFANIGAWTAATVTAHFPVAVVRLPRGHSDVTLNPAPILVSLLPTHRIGMGLASISDRILSFGGTHGSLSTASSLGMLMTNFRDTHDDIGTTVRAQLDGFADLGESRFKKSGGELTSDWLLARDPRRTFAAPLTAPAAPTPATALEVWITADQLKWMGDAGALYVELRRPSPDDQFGDVLASSYLTAHADESAAASAVGWRVSADKRRYVLPLGQMSIPPLDPYTGYEFRVSIDRRIQRAGQRPRSGTKDVVIFSARTDANGQLWPY